MGLIATFTVDAPKILFPFLYNPFHQSIPTGEREAKPYHSCHFHHSCLPEDVQQHPLMQEMIYKSLQRDEGLDHHGYLLARSKYQPPICDLDGLGRSLGNLEDICRYERINLDVLLTEQPIKLALDFIEINTLRSDRGRETFPQLQFRAIGVHYGNMANRYDQVRKEILNRFIENVEWAIDRIEEQTEEIKLGYL